MPRRKAIPRRIKIDVLVEAGYRCANPTCSIVLTPDILEDHHVHAVADGGGNETSCQGMRRATVRCCRPR